MTDKRLRKIKNLLDLANDANDEESRTALAKAQELMLTYGISEDEVFDHKQVSAEGVVLNRVIYSGRPQKWLYRLSRIIARNFRVKFCYESGKTIMLRFVGLEFDLQVAEITFQYAKGSVSYLAKKYMQQPEIKRKRKRKWQLKQDYIEGYLLGLTKSFEEQVLTNGYELALQLPDVVTAEIEKMGLVKGKDTSHKVKDQEAFSSGYQEGLKFKTREKIGEP